MMMVLLRTTSLLVVLLLISDAAAANTSDAQEFAPVSVDQPQFMLFGLKFHSRVVIPRQMQGSDGNVSWSVTREGDMPLGCGWVEATDGISFNVDVHVNNLEGRLIYRFVWPSGEAYSVAKDYRAMPGVLCLLPPLVAMLLVVVLREATLGLFFGVLVGAILLAMFNPLQGFLDTIALHFVNAWCERDNGEVVVFALMLGGWTALIRRSGGFQDLTQKIMTSIPLSSRSGAMIIFVLGCVIQLSGHLSIFLLGSSVVDLSDQTHLSRDKLTFLIDATAAPVASLSLVSSFMAVQTSYIEQEFTALGYTTYGSFEAFLLSIPQGYYQLNVLIICALVSLLNREMFTMYAPERQARVAIDPANASHATLFSSDDPKSPVPAVVVEEDESGVVPDDRAPVAHLQVPPDPFVADARYPWRWWNAVVPFVVMLAVTIVAVFVIGLFNARDAGIASPSLSEMLAKAKAVKALLWGMLSSTAVAMIMLLVQKRKLLELIDEWGDGCKSMLPAMMMLVMAWALSEVVQGMHLGKFVGGGLSGGLPAGLLPSLVVLLSFFVSFASGTSFGTMGVMFPISIPAAYAIAPNSTSLMITTIAATISGANAGDHCSPFSDTTILSALMGGIPNMQHVKTQIPYALMAMIVALLFGFLPVGFGLNPWISNALQLGVLVAIVVLFGKPVGNYSAQDKTCTAQDEFSLASYAWGWIVRRFRQVFRREYDSY